MSAVGYNKFNLFTDDLVKGVFNFGGDAFKIMLTNVAPIATNHLFADLSEIAAGNGYAAGGSPSAITLGNVGGTETVTAADVTFTGAGGSIGPFRYAVFYDSTPAGQNLVCWYDYGAPITINAGGTFTVEPNAGVPAGTLFTLA
jgi:hypothetical protein